MKLAAHKSVEKRNYQPLTLLRRVEIRHSGGEFAIQATTTFVLPDKSKDIVVTPMGEMISVATGYGWAKQGLVPATPEQLKESRKEYFRNTILTLKIRRQPELHGKSFKYRINSMAKLVNIIQLVSNDGDAHNTDGLDTHFGQTMTGPATSSKYIPIIAMLME